ncbi:MAG: hypothetical protein L0Y36_07145 [Planctomycetales bacterium]|nr:hypothetical protein [Planctomycetales bacterium]
MNLLLMAVLFISVAAQAGALVVANHSFESPVVPPGSNPPAYPVVSGWIELDMDPLGYSQNTGVFTNVPYAYIVGADANQLAFLGGERGNALLQDLSATYQEGKNYRLTVGICVSGYTPFDPNGLKLSFYYRDPNVVEMSAAQTPPPSHFTSTALEDCSVYLPNVQAGAACIGKPIGIAISAAGPMGGYWDLDNVRVTEYPLMPNFTDDSIVNLADFAMMAADWFSCDDPFKDVTGEGCVDEQDLLIVAEYWLRDV